MNQVARLLLPNRLDADRVGVGKSAPCVFVVASACTRIAKSAIRIAFFFTSPIRKMMRERITIGESAGLTFLRSVAMNGGVRHERQRSCSCPQAAAG